MSKDSVGHKEQEIMNMEYGGPMITRSLANESKEWNNEAIDALLDGFLANGLPYAGNGPCLLKVTMRSWNAVKNMLWKLAVNYDRKSVRLYTPVKRADRKEIFCTRDLAFIEQATSDTGIENGAHDIAYLSKLTNFPKEKINRWLDQLAKGEQGFFKEDFGVVGKDIARAKLVHKTLHGQYDLAIKTIGEQ